MTVIAEVPQAGGAMPYLLRKNGYYYSLNSRGYTERPELAELYTEEEARKHAAAADEVSAVPLCDAIHNVDRLRDHLRRIERMIEALTP